MKRIVKETEDRIYVQEDDGTLAVHWKKSDNHSGITALQIVAKPNEFKPGSIIYWKACVNGKWYGSFIELPMLMNDQTFEAEHKFKTKSLLEEMWKAIEEVKHEEDEQTITGTESPWTYAGTRIDHTVGSDQGVRDTPAGTEDL